MLCHCTVAPEAIIDLVWIGKEIQPFKIIKKQPLWMSTCKWAKFSPGRDSIVKNEIVSQTIKVRDSHNAK